MNAEASGSDQCGSDNCCGNVVFDGASPAYKRVLVIVIALNIAGLAATLVGGLIEGSTALAANALDFLADSATYALSLWVIGRTASLRSKAALFKSTTLVIAAIAVLGFAVMRVLAGAEPEGTVITTLGLVGAGINLLAALLLVRYRNGDANVRSVWLCTRNDLIECLAIAATGIVVTVVGSRWPDIAAGTVLAAIFLQSAYAIAKQARDELALAHSAP